MPRVPADSSFSRTQLGKPRGRKCQACLSSNTISATPSDCNGSSRACGPSDELSAAGIISSLVSAPGVTSENMGSSLPASGTSSLSSMGSAAALAKLSAQPAVLATRVRALETQCVLTSTSVLSSSPSDLVETHTPSQQTNFLCAGLVEKKLNMKEGSRNFRGRGRGALLNSALGASPT
jgi:hypothetical protein